MKTKSRKDVERWLQAMPMGDTRTVCDIVVIRLTDYEWKLDGVNWAFREAVDVICEALTDRLTQW